MESMIHADREKSKRPEVQVSTPAGDLQAVIDS